MVHRRIFTPEDATPESRFVVPPTAVALKAYNHCNLHGVWESEDVSVPPLASLPQQKEGKKEEEDDIVEEIKLEDKEL